MAAVACGTMGCSRETPQPAVQTTQTTTDPETQKLQTMAARFAPVDLTADVSKLPDNERQALAKLIAASKIFDALFLRQVWEGNEAMLLDLARDDSPLGRARRHYFLINKGPWSRLDANEVFIPGAPKKPEEAQLLPGRCNQGRRRGVVQDAERCGAHARNRVLHNYSPRTRWQVHRRSLQPRVSGRDRARRGVAARSGGADDAADAEELSREARRQPPEQRLLRQRRRVDGARRQHRADHRPVRGLRGRVVQLQGRVRIVHHASRRRGD